MRPAVFLDRDGVLNEVVMRGETVGSPRSLEEFRVAPGVGPALAALRAAGFWLGVVTNQPDLARGLMSPDILAAMHEILVKTAPVDQVMVCAHDNHHQCDCRKPRPGMLLSLASRHGLDLAHSYMIGDSGKDMGAARAAGVCGILLDRPYNQGVESHLRADSLDQACQMILNQRR